MGQAWVFLAHVEPLTFSACLVSQVGSCTIRPETLKNQPVPPHTHRDLYQSILDREKRERERDGVRVRTGRQGFRSGGRRLIGRPQHLGPQIQ